jgi:hypothetical protein
MTTRITIRDWEALSAYLDKQLNAKDRDRLVTRLDENPELRSALEELRRTRAVLRSQPRLRAPRNFTLTAEMAGVRSGFRPSAHSVPGSYPVLRLASVLATIFFIVITVGELAVRTVVPAPLTVAISQDQPVAAPFGMGGGGGGAEGPGQPAPPAAVEAPAPMLEASVASEAVTAEMAPTEGAAARAAPTATVAGEAAATEAAAVQALAPNVAPAPTQAVGAQEQPLGALPSQAADQQALAVTPLAPEPTPTPVAVAKQAASGQPQAEEPAQPVENVAAAAPAESQPAAPSPRISGLALLHVLQILLALLAIGSGLAALYLRRSARS